MGYHPWGHKELDVTEQLTYTQCHPIHFTAEETEGIYPGFLSPLSQVRYGWSVLTRAGNLCLAETPDDSSGFSESEKFSPVRW